MSHADKKAQIEANSAAILKTEAGEAINDAGRMIGMALVKMAHFGKAAELPATFKKGMQLGDKPPIFIKISIAHNEDELE